MGFGVHHRIDETVKSIQCVPLYVAIVQVEGERIDVTAELFVTGMVAVSTPQHR